MSRTVKIVLGVAALGGMGLGGLFLFVLSEGPRMKVQPHVRAFQRVAPLPPAGSVSSTPSPFPSALLTAAAPLPPQTPENLLRGKAYYELFCLFCHGEKGKGDGPVGQSYHPAPADLAGATTRLHLPALHVAMLTGTGHSPVLEQVVPAPHRPFLVLYIRSLGR
ncbi:MAG TPA: cytochrome C [Verrucomicrobiae bacterium]|nr:cytochrome C [Verrucomicrobiae bacterium]